MSTTGGNYYEALGVTPSATQDELRTAYRKAGMQWHPDRHKDSQESRDKFIALSQAFYVLSRAESRKTYDEYLKAGPTAEPPQFEALDQDDAEGVFRREMSLLAGELRSMGVPRDSLAQSLIKRGCPERVALEATGKQEPPKRAAAVTAQTQKKDQPKEPRPMFGRKPPPPSAQRVPAPPLKERMWAVLTHGLLVLVALPFVLIPPREERIPIADLPSATATAVLATATALAPTPTPTPEGATPQPDVTPAPEEPQYAIRYVNRIPTWGLLLLPVPIVVSYVVYLRSRRDHEYLAFHGLQAAIFQLIIVALASVLGAVGGLLLLVGAIYGLTAVIFVMIGWEFSYLLIGRLARGILDRVHK